MYFTLRAENPAHTLQLKDMFSATDKVLGGLLQLSVKYPAKHFALHSAKTELTYLTVKGFFYSGVSQELVDKLEELQAGLLHLSLTLTIEATDE